MSLPEFVTNMKHACSLIKEAQAVINRGPLDYYLRKLVEQSEALLTVYAPIKVGQRARIVKKIKCEGGWRGCDEMLAIGAMGEVLDVDYADGHFVCDFCPDEQFYVRDGKRIDCSRHTYRLRAEQLMLE